MSILARLLTAAPADATRVTPTRRPLPDTPPASLIDNARQRADLSRSRMLDAGAVDVIGMVQAAHSGNYADLIDGLHSALQAFGTAPGNPTSTPQARTSRGRTIRDARVPVDQLTSRAPSLASDMLPNLPDQPQAIFDPYAGSAGVPPEFGINNRARAAIVDFLSNPHPELSNQELEDLHATYRPILGDAYGPFGPRPSLATNVTLRRRNPAVGSTLTPQQFADYQAAIQGLRAARPSRREVTEASLAGQSIDDPSLLRRPPIGPVAAQAALAWARENFPGPEPTTSRDPRTPYDTGRDLPTQQERLREARQTEVWTGGSVDEHGNIIGRHPAFPIASQGEKGPSGKFETFTPKPYESGGSTFIDAHFLPTEAFVEQRDRVNLDRPLPPEMHARLLAAIETPQTADFLRRASTRPELTRVLIQNGIPVGQRRSAIGALQSGTLPGDLPSRAMLDLLNAMSPNNLKGNALFRELGYTSGYGRNVDYKLPSAPGITTSALNRTSRPYLRQWGSGNPTDQNRPQPVLRPDPRDAAHQRNLEAQRKMGPPTPEDYGH